MQDDPEKNNVLKLRFFGGTMKGEEMEFDPANQTTVRLGRNKNSNDIHINDNLLSKVQFSIQFQQDQQQWVLVDGSTSRSGEHRQSTNGTWLYVGEKMPMHSGMVFKANQTLFKVSLQAR